MEGIRSVIVASVLLAAVLLAGAAAARGSDILFTRNGNTVTMSGSTNLAAGDRLLVNVVSAAFTPTEKTQPGGFSGASGTVTVEPGSPLNSWHFDVDVSGFVPGVYIVTVESPDTGFQDSGRFILPWTPVPTGVPATPEEEAAPGSAPSPAITSVQGPQASPTKSPLPVLVSLGATGIAALFLLRSR